MKPFTIKEYNTPSAIEKLLKKVPQRNFLIDVNNLLVQEILPNISSNQIHTLEQKYEISNSYKKYPAEMNAFFAEFVGEHLGNTESEFNSYQSMRKLQEILRIPESEFRNIYEPVAEKMFTNFVNDIFNISKKCSEEEENEIEGLRVQYGIEQSKEEKITTESRTTIVKNYLDKIIEDSRVSPEEIEIYENLCKDLSVRVNMDDQSRMNLEKYKNLWHIENNELPTQEPDILLPKNELCYKQCKAKLYENRKVTTRVSYGGATFRVKIMKGVYFRAGNIGVGRQSDDVTTLIDEGSLYLTSKKILFYGSKQNKTIKYNQIIDLIPYTDEVEIIKETGKPSSFHLLDADGEIITAIIAKVIKESHL